MHERHDAGPPVGPQVIFELDRAGTCTRSTGPGLERLGVRAGELVGRNLLEVYRDDQNALDALTRVLGGERFAVEREYEGRRLSVYYEPVFDSEGQVSGAIGISTDVTEQRRIEEEVRRARERATVLADLSESLTLAWQDPEDLRRVAVRQVTEALADAGVLWLRTSDGRSFQPRASWGLDPARAGALVAHPPLAAAAVDRMEGAELVDGIGQEHWSCRAATTPDWSLAGAVVRVPLRSRQVTIGLLELVRRASRFDPRDLELLAQMSQRCALALDNAALLESQRAASEELVKFQALADASNDLIVIVGDDNRLAYANPRVWEYGVDLADGLWATVARHLDPATTEAIDTALARSGRWSGDVSVSIGGRALEGRLEVFPLAHPASGAGMGTAWLWRDFTALRTTEHALRERDADLKQFRALVEASPDFIAIAGLDGAVRYVNPAGRRLVGLPQDLDITTTSIPDYLTQDGLRASIEVEQPAVVAEGHWEGESTLRNQAGHPIPVAIASFLIRDADTGKPFALATVQRDISERIAAEDALRELADQRQALLSRLVDAQEAERSRIAADVHDDPVQALAAVDLRLGLLRRSLRERAPELLTTLATLQTSVSGATDRLRALLFDLEPPDLRLGLSAALRTAASEIFDGTGTSWTVEGDDARHLLPDATRTVMYRIAKEAMNNARRHAGATRAGIRLRSVPGGVELTVTDNGRGLPVNAGRAVPGHRGMSDMQDRATVAGGFCTVTNAAEGGAQITAWLPAPSAAD